MSKLIRNFAFAILAALVLSACGTSNTPDLPETIPGTYGVACPPGYAKDGSGSDAEDCERDRDGNRIGDDDEGRDKKKVKKTSSNKSKAPSRPSTPKKSYKRK